MQIDEIEEYKIRIECLAILNKKLIERLKKLEPIIDAAMECEDNAILDYSSSGIKLKNLLEELEKA